MSTEKQRKKETKKERNRPGPRGGPTRGGPPKKIRVSPFANLQLDLWTEPVYDKGNRYLQRN